MKNFKCSASPEQGRVWKRSEKVCESSLEWVGKVSGVMCDERNGIQGGGEIAMLYGLETVAPRKRPETKSEVAEVKTSMFFLGVTRIDRI